MAETEQDRAARVLAERARALATPVAEEEQAALPIVAFEAGPERYGISMGAVLRIERVGNVARVPGAAASIVGVFAVDGRPCALVDVPALLGAAPAPAAAPRRFAIVLGRKGPELALAADAVDLGSVVTATLRGAAAPRLGTTPDARVVLDASALLPAHGPDGGAHP